MCVCVLAVFRRLRSVVLRSSQCWWVSAGKRTQLLCLLYKWKIMADEDQSDPLDRFLMFHMRKRQKHDEEPAPTCSDAQEPVRTHVAENYMQIPSSTPSSAAPLQSEEQHVVDEGDPQVRQSSPWYRSELPVVYWHWVPRIGTPMTKPWHYRGQQLRNLKLGSMYTGCAPEDAICHLLKFNAEHLFHIDGSPWGFISACAIGRMMYDIIGLAWKTWWLMANVIASNTARNARSRNKKHQIVWSPASIGVPLRPAGLDGSNHGCLTPTSIDNYLMRLEKHRPRSSVLENVLGFLKPEASGRTPLEYLLVRWVELGLDQICTSRIFVTNGELMMNWVRSRMYFVTAFR